MPHVRQQIRDQVAALLTGLITTGDRVFKSRMRPQDQLPCLLVITADEDVETGSSGSMDRTLSVVVRGFAKGNAGLDDTLDQIALEVETVLSPTGFELRKIETDFDDELEKPVGSITLTFQFLYFTQAGNPGASA